MGELNQDPSMEEILASIRRIIAEAGHFPHLETPEVVSGELIRWAKAL